MVSPDIKTISLHPQYLVHHRFHQMFFTIVYIHLGANVPASGQMIADVRLETRFHLSQ